MSDWSANVLTCWGKLKNDWRKHQQQHEQKKNCRGEIRKEVALNYSWSVSRKTASENIGVKKKLNYLIIVWMLVKGKAIRIGSFWTKIF